MDQQRFKFPVDLMLLQLCDVMADIINNVHVKVVRSLLENFGESFGLIVLDCIRSLMISSQKTSCADVRTNPSRRHCILEKPLIDRFGAQNCTATGATPILVFL